MENEEMKKANEKYITLADFSTRLNLGIVTAKKIAIKADALIKINKTVRVDWEKAQKYIDSECVVKE